MGFLDAILGTGDQTPDSTGLTPNDKAQTGFHGLTNLGAILMAGGQPMWGNERAKYLAAIGQVPKGMEDEKASIVGQRRQAQQLVSDKMKNQNQELIQKMGADPALLDSMPESMKGIYKMAAATGNLSVMAEIQKQLEPKMSYGGVYDPRTKKYVNQFGMQVDMSGNGPSGGAQSAPAALPATADPTTGLDKETGINEQLISQVPEYHPGFRDKLRKIGLGLLPYPTSARSDPDKPLLDQHLSDPNLFPGQAPFSTDDFKNRATMRQSISSGQLGQKFIYPVQRAINHGATVLNRVDEAGLVDNTGITPDSPDGSALGGLAATGKNAVTAAEHAAKGDGKMIAVHQAVDNFMTEFSKAMRGTGGTTDEAARNAKIKSVGEELAKASTPTEYHAVIKNATEFMLGQAAPIAGQYRAAMRRPGRSDIDLLGEMAPPDTSPGAAPNVRENLQKIHEYQSASRKQMLGAAPAAPAQVSGAGPAQVVPAAPAAHKVPQAAIDAARARGWNIQ